MTEDTLQWDDGIVTTYFVLILGVHIDKLVHLVLQLKGPGDAHCDIDSTRGQFIIWTDQELAIRYRCYNKSCNQVY